MIKVYTIGGYEEVGKNMTAIEYENEVIIIDMGIRLDRVLIHEDVNFQKMSSRDLRKLGAIPDDTIIKNKKVVAIVLSHGHLDHIGAIAKPRSSLF